MNILVCGARGFVGAAICARLERDGHRIFRGVRDPQGVDEIAIDYARDTESAVWLPRLAGIDVVVNAVGILVEHGRQTFDAIHRRAPIALFSACATAGVGRIVQISALGAQTRETAYFDSKYAADASLASLPVGSQIVRPSLVYGESGTSARLFRMLASVPVHVLPAGGRQALRPVHIDDLVDVVARLLDPATPCGQSVDVVGATVVDYRGMLRTYRAAMGLPGAPGISVARPLMDMLATLLDRVPGSPFTRDTWRMLQNTPTPPAAQTAAVLGREPRGIASFIAADAPSLRAEALAAWRDPLLRAALAIVWLGSALVSAFVFPRAASLALLERTHISGAAALPCLVGAAALDFVLGVATIARPGRRLWQAQLLLVAAYTIVIGITMPEFLSHPFGPILKNVPILAILVLLLAEERRP
jgi:uncharacterized protein YbjT (DUF2867 family)